MPLPTAANETVSTGDRRSRSRLVAAVSTEYRRLDRSALVVVALTALGFALRLRGFHDGLDRDEGFTLNITRGRDFLGVLDAVESGARPGQPLEYNPPLFSVLAWLGAMAGDSTDWIRLPSLVLGSATVPIVFLLGLKTVGRRAGLVAAGFMALSPFAIFYGTEARAYAALMFFGALSALMLVIAVQTGRARWWAAYGVAVAAVLYTHYTGVFVIGVEAAWALWFHRDRWRALVLSLAGVAAAYSVWLPHMRAGVDLSRFKDLATAFGFNHWDALGQWLVGLHGFALEDMPGVPALVLLACGVGVGVIGGAVASAGRRTWRRRRSLPSSPALLVLLLALATPISLALYAIVGDDLFIFPRNLSASLPFAALAVGWAITPPSRVLTAIAVGLAGVGLGIGALKMRDDRFQRPHYVSVARLLDDRAGPQDLVLYHGPGLDPFSISNEVSVFYERTHVVAGSDTREQAVERGFARAPRERVFVVQKDATVPPSLPAWEQVEQRAFTGNPRLVVAVYDRLRPDGYQLTSRSIRRPDGTAIPSVPGRVPGTVERAEVTSEVIRVSGWAATPDHRPVHEVLAFVGGRLVAAGIPNSKRPDLARKWDVAPDDLGFSLALPRAIVERSASRVSVFGVGDGVATRMQSYCTRTVRKVVEC